MGREYRWMLVLGMSSCCIRPVLVLSLLLGLGACTTAADHTAAIDAFAQASTDAAGAVKAYDKATAQRVTELNIEQATDEAPNLLISYPAGECTSGAADCTIGVTKADNQDAKPRPITVTTVNPKHVFLASKISEYGKALQDVANADSTTQVNAALQQVATTIEGVASLYPGGGGAAGAIAGPTANALTWAYGKYQESIKMDALRKATTAMDQPMHEAAKALGLLPAISRSANINRRQAEFDQAFKDYNATLNASEKDRGKAIAVLLEKQKALSDVLKSPSSDVFADLATAHSQLVESLTDKPDSLEDLVAAIKRVQADAAEIRAIAESFQAATGSTATQ